MPLSQALSASSACFSSLFDPPPPPRNSDSRGKLTRSVSSVLLDSGSLAVESIVGGALEAFGANARGPAAGGLVAESGERVSGARGGTEAEHCCV